MINVLGLPLAVAVQRLAEVGYLADVKELCCRKGPVGDDARVLRQITLGEHEVELTYAYFSTEPQQAS